MKQNSSKRANEQFDFFCRINSKSKNTYSNLKLNYNI